MAWCDYITMVKEQIRNKKAKLLIEDELKDHIEEQINAYQEEGANYEEAEKMAILDMGDPIEVGTELNRIHRPKLEKKMLIMIVFFGLFGLLVQYLVGSIIMGSENTSYFLEQFSFTIIGIVVMALIYFFDYTIIGKYPFAMWCMLYLIGMYVIRFVPPHYNQNLSMFVIMYLFMPIYAGVLFRLRKLKLVGLIFSGMIGATPILLAYYGKNLTAIIHYTIFLIVILNIAVGKRLFGICKKLGFTIVWLCTVGVPLVFFIMNKAFGIELLSEYQKLRFRLVFTGTTDIQYTYTTNLAKEALSSSKIIGSNTEIISKIPLVESNYILIFIFNMFGIVAGALVVGLLLYLLYKAFGIGRKQRSVLGYMVAMACSLSLLIQTMFSLASNLGFYRIIHLAGQQVLPFLSSGASNIVYSYAIAGLLLSVYRNSDIVSDRTISNKASLLGKIKLRS